MIEYAKSGAYRLDTPPVSWMQWLPRWVKKTGVSVIEKLQYHLQESWLTALQGGTRSWEYPWVLERLGTLSPASKILDIGCGTSDFPYNLYLRGWTPIGLDYYQTAQSQAGYGITERYARRIRELVQYIGGTMEKIPLKSSNVDAITCISLMEHIVINCMGDIPVRRRCLTEAWRVLKPGGLLVFTYDTTIDKDVIYGWDFNDDIKYLQNLGMQWQQPGTTVPSRQEISLDEDTFFVPPAVYIRSGYCTGCQTTRPYHRVTSVGFALVK